MAVTPLTPQERAISYSKYFDMPLELPTEDEMRQLEKPMDPADAIPCSRLTEAFPVDGRFKVENGWCIMPDGSGYAAMMVALPRCTVEMLDWWFSWFTIPPKSVSPDCGNLRYKIWCPPDHWDHVIIEGSGGHILAEESFDMGGGDPRWKTVHCNMAPRDYGMTDSHAAALKEAGISFGCSVNSSEGMCDRIGMSLKHPLPGGGCIARARYWFGWGLRDGAPFRDYGATQFTEELVKKILIHNIIENRRLNSMLPQLYAEQKGRPLNE